MLSQIRWRANGRPLEISDHPLSQQIEMRERETKFTLSSPLTLRARDWEEGASEDAVLCERPFSFVFSSSFCNLNCCCPMNS